MTLTINVLPAMGGRVHITAMIGTDQVFAAEVWTDLAEPVLHNVLQSLTRRLVSVYDASDGPSQPSPTERAGPQRHRR